jgi:cell wall-associated NlpC family hydrolase
VRFDFEAADTAARELELTSQSLIAAAALLEEDVPVVAGGWEGRFREVFDVESLMHDVAARALAGDLLTLAAQIRAKAVEAAAQQAV